MRLFLDTADVAAIEYWKSTGIINGITTNPSLLSMQKEDPKKVIQKIVSIMGDDGVVSVEVTETEPAKVYQQARKIADLGNNIIVKIPCHLSYYPIIEDLVLDEVPLNITLVFSLAQAIFMSNLGVLFISPFIGRLSDINEDGILFIQQLCKVFENYPSDTGILAASIRNKEQFNAVALAGADVTTLPVKLLEELTAHQLTDSGMKKFNDDWKKLGITQFP